MLKTLALTALLAMSALVAGCATSTASSGSGRQPCAYYYNADCPGGPP